MNDYRSIMKKVGIALIAIGTVDVAYMIYCIIHSIGYSSSFNIFAIIAGVYLYRGNLKSVRIISWFSAFLSSAFIGVMVLFPFFTPIDLMTTYIRLYPIAFIAYSFIAIALIIFLIWVYKTLNSEVILTAITQNNVDNKRLWRKPKNGFIFGGCLPVILAIIMSVSLFGETPEKAKIEAEKITGSGYKYSVTSWNINSTFGGKTFYRVNVTAYNDHEIKDVHVEWEK
jgi:hypothetical protein